MARKYVLGPNAAREFKRLIRGSGEVSRRQNMASAFAFDSEFVFPFTVQWAQSAADGEGSWIIWLPGNDIVSVDGAPYDPTDGLDEVGGDYPEGWYLLDGDALDKDEGGKLYLNITGGTSHTCEFSASAQTGVEDSHSVAICEASVDAETGARSVKQFVTSSIIIASGEEDDDDKYYADEHSITQYAAAETGSESPIKLNYFHLNGFGKFKPEGFTSPIGTYQAPTNSTVDLDGDAPNFAFICRDGNSSSPDSNTLSYRKISFRGSNVSSPFKYEKTTTTDPNTHQQVTLHKICNCKFYWNGVLKELSDFDVSALMGGGTAYLRGKQAEPSQQNPDPEWEWSVGANVLAAPNNGKALNYKLYDFAASKVAIDYRTTFLALDDHTQKAKLEIKKPGSTAGITLDSSGTVPKLVITDGKGKSVTIDLADIPAASYVCPSQKISIHEFRYKSTDIPEEDWKVHHFLGCSDIDLTKIRPEGKTIKDVDVTPTATETVVTFTYTDDSTTEIHIPHGLKGKQGDKGDDGDTPEIWGVKNGEVTTVYADGEVIATINDGHTPQITAEKKDGVTTIYVDGNAVAQIQDGGVGQYDSITCISGIKFEISGGKLKAKISKQTFDVPDTFDMHPVEKVDDETIDVCDVSELDVVTEEEYSASSHQFTNKRKRVQVIGTAEDATGQTPFTATPLSGE